MNAALALITGVLYAKHALFGAVALASLGVALVTTKGGRLHERSGVLHLFVMALVLFSALALCGVRLIQGDPAHRDASVLLAVLAVLIAEQLTFGMRVLKWHGPESVRPAERMLTLLTAIAGLGGVVWALTGAETAQSAVAGVLAILTAASHRRQQAQTPVGLARVAAHRTSLQAAGVFTVGAVLFVNWAALAPA